MASGFISTKPLLNAHSRCPIYADASLGPKELVAEYPDATFPDGFTFDSQGGVWAVSVASNRIIHVDVNGHQTIVLEDADAKEMAEITRVFEQGEPVRDMIELGGTRPLKTSQYLFRRASTRHFVYGLAFT